MQRGICSAPQIFKVLLRPGQCGGSKKYFIISGICLTSVSGHRNSAPTRFQAALQGDAFFPLTCLRGNCAPHRLCVGHVLFLKRAEKSP